MHRKALLESGRTHGNIATTKFALVLSVRLQRAGRPVPLAFSEIDSPRVRGQPGLHGKHRLTGKNEENMIFDHHGGLALLLKWRKQ